MRGVRLEVEMGERLKLRLLEVREGEGVSGGAGLRCGGWVEEEGMEVVEQVEEAEEG